MRRLFVFTLLVTLLLLLSEWLRLPLWSAFHWSPQWDEDNSGPRNVTILLWHWPFTVPYSLRGDVCLERYNVTRCRLVDRRSSYPEADVVVFHNRELITGSEKLPLHLPRLPGQRWVWLSLEAPQHNGHLQPFAGVFNLTMSYRRDADIRIPYGKLVPKEPGNRWPQAGVLQNKSTPVCWVVSNYQSHHRRSQVYNKLTEMVPVTVYGRWNSKLLHSNDLLPTISRCYFYLAFENTESKDYITEKLWRNAYQAGVVPVVLGAQLDDYKAVAPRDSFIHVDEFESVAELGRCLKQLVRDRRSYARYFRWQRDWDVKLYTDWRERLCNICLQYDDLPQQKIYSDLEAWVQA